MHTGIQEEALRAMLEGGAVREVLVSRHGEKWGLPFAWAVPAVAGGRCVRDAKRCARGPV